MFEKMMAGVCAGAGLFAFAAGAQCLAADSKTDTQLDAFRAAYVAAIVDEEAPPLVARSADDVLVMPEFQKSLQGKDAATAYYAAFFDRFDVRDYRRTTWERLDLGGQIVEIGGFEMDVTHVADGKTFDLDGAYFDIWEKSGSGELTLITQAWNYDSYYDGFEPLASFDDVPSMHMAFQPNVVVDDNLTFELAALNRLHDAAVTQHDAGLWGRFFADDGVHIPNHRPAYRGRKAIDDFLALHMPELPVFEELDIRTNRIDRLDGYVIEYASHIASWRNGASSGVGLGKNIRVWRREPDHSLKIIRMIAMYD